MSGIVGLVNLDGAPVDRDLLARMTSFLAFRGPDAQETWCNGSVGFGHAMLRTTFEAERERQPCSLDGEVWLTADARVDARDDLKRELEAAGRRDVKDATDAELILHAYHAWGERCVEHLLGDFAFAIWDGPQRRLFCARDHFGVKPFYYARLRLSASAGQAAGSETFVFSNTLNCVRLHPEVSSELNELAIADFLLFGCNQETDTTTFSDIQCLAPAHSLSFNDSRARPSRYWSLVREEQRYPRSQDYVDRFLELLETAVADRTRTRNVALLMSGGLDSTSVAAAATTRDRRKERPLELLAFTLVSDRLVPDEERRWSTVAARALGIPIRHLPIDDYALFDRWDDADVRPPEPADWPLWSISIDTYNTIAPVATVTLTGEGADAVLASPRGIGHELAQGHYLRLLSDVLVYIRLAKRIPVDGLAARLGGWLRPERPVTCPEWLHRRFVNRLALRDRMAERPHLPGERLLSPVWPWCLLLYDAGWVRAPVESRHPFCDVRILHFLSGVPGLPWRRNKQILRESMRGLLPEEVRTRPKAQLALDPALQLLRARPESDLLSWAGAAARRGFLDVKRLEQILGDFGPDQGIISALSLSRWLELDRVPGR